MNSSSKSARRSNRKLRKTGAAVMTAARTEGGLKLIGLGVMAVARALKRMAGRRSACVGLGAMVCGALPQGAEATIFIRKANGTAVPATNYTITYNFQTGGYTIRLTGLYAPQQDSVYEIHGDGGENIDLLDIDVDGPAAGSPVIVRILSDGALGIGGVYNVVQNGTGETLLNRVDIKGELGSVSVQAIGDIDTAGDVTGPIVATTQNNATRGINSVEAQGDILGDIRAQGGKISLVLAWGAIGEAGNNVEIQAKYGITQISAINGIHADVTTRYGGGTGKLWAMTTTKFDGVLDTEGLMSHPNNGSAGYLWYSQEFTGRVNIGKGLSGAGQYVLLPVGGLKGQIVVNADNAAGQTWTAPVKVGADGDPQQVVVNGPGYSQSRNALGGGSVGLVPFGLHSSSCSPVNGGSVEASAGMQVRLTHYGPVTWQPGYPVSVERRTAGSSGAWTVQPGVGYSYSLDGKDENTVVVSGAAGQAGFEGGYQYRIKPTSLLKCEVNGLPSVVWGADYLVTVNAAPQACPADATGDGEVDIDDLTQVILNWNTPFMPSVADLNEDNQVNIDDLTMVILSWGTCG